MPPELPGLIGKVKAADPDCRWFFEWAAPPDREGIGIWLDSVPDVVYLAARSASRESASGEPVSRYRTPTIWPRTRQVRYPCRSGRDIRDELSAASSDFALRLLTARSRPQLAPIALAIAHMRIVAALVPDAARLPFLFQCWHHWAAPLSPQARVECGEAAGRWVGSVTPERAWTGLVHAWSGYQQALGGIIGEARAGATAAPARTGATAAPARTGATAAPARTGATAAPANYLLFDHARRTHARLGIRPAAQALAARVVRAEHAAGQAHAPWPADPSPIADVAALAELDPV